MPLKLVPPGERKGNPFYLVRGTFGGRRYEVSAKTTDPSAARAFKRDFEQTLGENRLPARGEALTFERAVKLYEDYRDPSNRDRAFLKRIARVIGGKFVADIRQADLVGAANLLYPNLAPGSKNRAVMRPAATVLHYAAENGYCSWLRVRLFREPTPATRAVSMDTATVIVRAAAGPQRLLLLWLFRQGTRISDALKVEWPRIDLGRGVVTYRIAKTDRWSEAPLHPELLIALANVPEEERGLYLFPWRTRSGVYKWLRPLAKRLNLRFTPHMARHSLGTWLNADGAGLRTIMSTLGHADPKSSIRYQSADIEIVRAAGRRLGGLLGEK
jgi:integrase